MILIEKIKEAAISVIPVMIVVWALHLTVAPMGDALYKFMIGGVLLIIGLGVFLVGAEIGIVPTGSRAGSALTRKRNLTLLLAAGFIIGFFITIAEPDVHVLAQQAKAVSPDIPQFGLVVMIASGVGLFVSVALARIVFQLSLRIMLAVFYALVFICAAFAQPGFLGIAFDAGGATTGPMTVPFIMALGIGVAAVRARSDNDDSFGLIGVASIGPILAVLVLGLFSRDASTAGDNAVIEQSASIWGHFLRYIPEVVEETGMALAPLIFLFILFKLFLFGKMRTRQIIRLVLGLTYTYLGLVCFFVGVKGGFIPAGTMLGSMLAKLDSVWIIVTVAFALGALAVCAEPAVWVLTRQVEEVSGGSIKSRIILVFLCVGVASAVALSLARLYYGFSLWAFLLPGYIVALAMTLICPPLFTAIAFDSGGVASGPLASTFILSFTLGAAHEFGNMSALDAFGAIALIAMTPLIAIQILGIIFKLRMRGAKR
ncbi:MAG: DUF1538 domain-containing protein [Desulfovibrio sp.]|nr:DUF1538 domain-containing protein [Desulfovibrio sp.]